MVVYVKVVYEADTEPNRMLFQKEFCLREYEHIRDERVRRNGEDFIACDSIEICQYDTDNHLEISARVGKLNRRFHFTKAVHVEIDEEIENG